MPKSLIFTGYGKVIPDQYVVVQIGFLKQIPEDFHSVFRFERVVENL